jgi:hypothetical protein
MLTKCFSLSEILWQTFGMGVICKKKEYTSEDMLKD